ncbi:alkaline phosphatase family protein [Arthrobacter oryzae]|uniref:Type I phosphodiesterase/nucleotide pyrophosphatase n=1 Tax=Arthrobacter oryzae TaxID=409290 RepID=A0A495ECP1_9MICC|nr:alkaline phosphatase family protein [Arthrobacter oryzae]RKR13687.1 type I phosphodiesterase/nucleotide pyrophosphatase [Arthrobacter oryzae]
MTSARTTAVTAAALLGAALLAGTAVAPSMADAGGHENRGAQDHRSGQRDRPDGTDTKHVLVLSVDGLHQKDLDWYVAAHPQSALAALVKHGTSYTHAQTPVPSDSFPGMVGQFTGGNPGTTGIYYDDTFNRALLPAGTTDCKNTVPGTEVALTEAADKDPNALDAGQGVTGLPSGIMTMTGQPGSLLNPAALPVDPATCKPVYPHQYLKVNTVFEVAKSAGLSTAWADKHPAYEILNGPSGKGVDDLFTPEINSQAPAPYTGDWTKDNAATQQYDGYKVQAVLNEIGGKDHSGTRAAAVPAIFGMNFQSVSTAQKLPTSDGLPGGYLPGGAVPGPLLSKALDYIDTSVGTLESALSASGHAKDTTVILSAKHGQSPMDPNQLTRVPDGAIIDGLNAAWKAARPGSADLVTFSTDDDIMQLWLADHSQAASQFAKDYLAAHPAAGSDINSAPRTLPTSGLSKIYAGSEVAGYFGTKSGDARYPDILGIAQTGVVYTGGKSKIAEHGGASTDDRNVPLVISGGNDQKARTVTRAVETTQIAPTILKTLGLNPHKLQAVQIEGTQALPQR